VVATVAALLLVDQLAGTQHQPTGVNPQCQPFTTTPTTMGLNLDKGRSTTALHNLLHMLLQETIIMALHRTLRHIRLLLMVLHHRHRDLHLQCNLHGRVSKGGQLPPPILPTATPWLHQGHQLCRETLARGHSEPGGSGKRMMAHYAHI
jgi:hypothetical protein